MATGDPILTALARMEERLVERVQDLGRELRLDLDGRFDAVHKRLDRMEQEYEMLEAGVARLEAEVGGLRSDVGALKSDLGTLRSDVGTLKSDVAELKHAVAQLQIDVRTGKQSIERLEAALERDAQDREDLREQVLGFRRRLGELEVRVREIESRLPPE